jgi:hypothetical protein
MSSRRAGSARFTSVGGARVAPPAAFCRVARIQTCGQTGGPDDSRPRALGCNSHTDVVAACGRIHDGDNPRQERFGERLSELFEETQDLEGIRWDLPRLGRAVAKLTHPELRLPVIPTVTAWTSSTRRRPWPKRSMRRSTRYSSGEGTPATAGGRGRARGVELLVSGPHGNGSSRPCRPSRGPPTRWPGPGAVGAPLTGDALR